MSSGKKINYGHISREKKSKINSSNLMFWFKIYKCKCKIENVIPDGTKNMQIGILPLYNYGKTEPSKKIKNKT